MAYLLVDITSTPAATLVTISGEVDLATIAQFRKRLDAVPDRDTVMEMSGVALLCAAGSRVLLDLQDRLVTAGARLVLAAASYRVRRVLTLIGLDAHLHMVPTFVDGFTWLKSGTTTQPVPASERGNLTSGPGFIPRGDQPGIRPGTAAGDVADKPAARPDGRSQAADQRSVSSVRDAIEEIHVVKSRSAQAEAEIRRADATSVRRTAAELSAHAAELRRQARATLQRGQALK